MDDSSSSNPLYPVDVDEYPKLFDYVPTARGLEYLHVLKRNHVIGRSMSLDECNKLRLLCVYYATANRNPKEVCVWQDICMTLDGKGLFEKGMFLSKEDLKSKSLIVPNPEYRPGLYREYVEHEKRKK